MHRAIHATERTVNSVIHCGNIDYERAPKRPGPCGKPRPHSARTFPSRASRAGRSLTGPTSVEDVIR